MKSLEEIVWEKMCGGVVGSLYSSSFIIYFFISYTFEWDVVWRWYVINVNRSEGKRLIWVYEDDEGRCLDIIMKRKVVVFYSFCVNASGKEMGERWSL